MAGQIWADHDSITIDGNHHYHVKGIQGWMPSCSTIAKHVDAGSSDGLLKWASEIALETGNVWGFKQSNKESLDIGSEVHKEISEHIIARMNNEETPQLASSLFWALYANIEELKPHWLASELKCARTDLWYGGTVDAVAIINDELVILDWKTAKQYTGAGAPNKFVRKDYAVQVGGYYALLEANEGFHKKVFINESASVSESVGDYFTAGKVKAYVVKIYKDYDPEREGSQQVELQEVNLPNAKKAFYACLDVYQSKGGLYVK